MRKSIVTIAIILFTLPCLARTYGPTKSSDHLWHIAVTIKPNKTVSVQQTMVAIQRATPKAFNGGNINSIKPGYYLQIPSLAKIKTISSYEAIREVNRQNVIWLKTPQKKAPSKKIRKTLHVTTSKRAVYGHVISGLVRLQRENKKNLNVLKQQLNDSNEAMADIQQKYHTRLDHLEQSNSSFKSQLQQQLQQMDEQMQNLKTQVQQLESKAKQHYDYWLISLIAVAVLFLILIISLSSCSRKRKNNTSNSEQVSPEEAKPALETKEPEIKEPDTKDTATEYDFLGSKEGIPAKLDLAQTYIDMEDKDAAAKVLKEIIQKGNAEQTKEAADLLRQIK